MTMTHPFPRELSLPLFVFIMAGGSGERFWPLSRQRTPKHLLRLFSDQTLLEQTVQRFEGIVPPEQIFILTNEAQWESTCKVLPEHPMENIIAEPAKRDTAAAATLATAIALRHHSEAIVGLFPADAMIHHTALFQIQLMEAALMAATTSALITFSIKPTYPAISFGYLDLGEKIFTSSNVQTAFHQVNSFVEKPPLIRAKEFVASAHHGWNAGMFLWKGTAFLKECQRQEPAFATFAQELLKSPLVATCLLEKFSQLPKVSLDYAIMEKAERVIAAVALFDWDDVGRWTALPAHLGVDAHGNTIKAPSNALLLHHSSNNIVFIDHSSQKTIALCGVKDLIVVETSDALLICHRDDAEQIKSLSLPENLR